MNFKKINNNKFYLFFLKIILCFLPILTLDYKTFANDGSQKILDSKYLESKKYEDYILSSGDYLDISIHPSIKELNGNYLIDGSGTINVPYLNRIFVKGLTVDELSSILDEKFEAYVNSPKTRINIINYRPIRFIIQGEIENPGFHTIAGSYNFEYIGNSNNDKNNIKSNTNSLEEYDYSDELFSYKSEETKSSYVSKNSYFPTIFDAIKKSGGITTYSDLSNIKVIRKLSISNGGGFKQTKLNLIDALFKNEMNQNIRILDGDRILIKKSKNKLNEQMRAAYQSNLNPKFMSVFVSGSVRQPGEKVITKRSALNDAIALAGGRLPLSGNIFLIRYENNGTTQKKAISFSNRAKKGSRNNPFLKRGDMIIVNENKLNIGSQVIKTATDPFLGVYSLLKLIQ
tara:strand:- start:20262 stop:21464 length:1203 start_codon:yes stop_codon:yes gene_type:complete